MKILLLAGGDSRERDVSLHSGQAIYDSLNRQGHKVFAIDPATGKSLLDSDGTFALAEPSDTAPESPPETVSARNLAGTIDSPGFADIDVVMLALHGGIGEDGSIQNLLALAGKKFTGSAMTASAVSMNKAVAKSLFEGVKVHTPEWELCRITGDEIDREILDRIRESLVLPVIVKPNDGGSTIGLSVVREESELVQALKIAAEISKDVLVEGFIKGRELTVSVFEGRAFPVVEIIPKSGLYDYRAKYTMGESKYICPAEIPHEVDEEVRGAALRVYQAVGAEGLARVDFLLAESGELCCLEINTLPGMTPLSLSPMAAKADGIDFDELVAMILDAAVRRD